MRAYRLERITKMLAERDYGGLLVFDPLNIRYATDSTNMQLWNMHNPFRACLVCADGYMVLWDYKNSPFLADHNPLVREVRSGAGLFYFATGDKTATPPATGSPARWPRSWPPMRAATGASRWTRSCCTAPARWKRPGSR